MSYIETLAPRDCGLYTLFVYPYIEGVRNLALVFPCCGGNKEYHPSLCERIGHLVLGVLLLIPVINTIIFVVLRFFMPAKVAFSEHTKVLKKNNLKDEQVKKINAFNKERADLHEKKSSLPKDDDTGRNELNKQLCAIESSVAKEMCHKAYKEVRRHLRYSAHKEKALVDWDGKITGALRTTSVQVKRKGVSGSEFTQVGGLSQLEGYNHLCGYYALFFMLQAVTGKDFTDRDAFHPLLKQWLKLIAVKRTTAWLSNHRDEPAPYGLNLSVKGLSPYEMDYLISQCAELAPLRETNGCFALDLEECFVNEPVSEPINLLGKSKAENKNPETFPLYFSLKVGMHYYFVYAKEPGKFTFVHSLNYSVLNPAYFDFQAFGHIIDTLTGKHSPLHLKW